MKKSVLFLLAAVLVAAMSAPSDAMMHRKGMKAGCNMHMGRGDGHGMMDRLRSLGLSDTQMEEVKAIHFRNKKEVIRKKADAEVAELELKEILAKDPVDMKSAEAKIRQIESLHSDLKIMHLKCREEIKGKLTPEQRKKFTDMTAGMPMGGGMGMMCEKCMMGGKCRQCMMHDMDDDDDTRLGADAPGAGHQHHGGHH